VDDISIKDCLAGIALRSPVKAGVLREIRTPRLPSTVTLITAADIPGVNGLSVYPGGEGAPRIPIIAEKKLSYRGQAAALLLGPDPAKLRELAEQCFIDAEEGEEEDLSLEEEYRPGGADQAFAGAALVVEGTYGVDFQAAWPGEPPEAIALPASGGGMIIHTAAQWPGHVRESAARALNEGSESIEVRVTRFKVRLDERLWIPSLTACQAAVAARARNRPVRIIAKWDDFPSPAGGTEIFLQTALDSRGNILGTRLKIRARLGPPGIFGAEVLDRIVLGALGAYGPGSLSFSARGKAGAIPPVLAGFGMAQGFFAAERHVSRIADALGEDPAGWRKNHFLRWGQKLPIGVEIREEAPLEELIDAVASMADYRRKWAANELLRKNRREHPSQEKIREPLRGVGIALAYQGSSFLYNPVNVKEGVELTLEKDGSLEIRTNFPWGDNQFHAWKTLTSRVLGVEEPRILSFDREKSVPESGPACLSRGMLITRLIEKACAAIRKQRFRDPLPITVRRYCQETKIQAWDRRPCDEGALSPLSWGSAVVEVEVDPVEYLPRIRGIWIALEGGTILAEEQARKTITLGVMDALCQAIPRREEIPPPAIDFLWAGGNVKGIGELPLNTVPAAYVQALSQALDYPFERYPIGSEDIWEAVQARSGSGEPGEAGAASPGNTAGEEKESAFAAPG
jgi:CO/xanthine dehydrogenase Mo-binding subunit